MRVPRINLVWQWQNKGNRDFTLFGIESSSFGAKYSLPGYRFNIHVVLMGLGFTLWLR